MIVIQELVEMAAPLLVGPEQYYNHLYFTLTVGAYFVKSYEWKKQ